MRSPLLKAGDRWLPNRDEEEDEVVLVAVAVAVVAAVRRVRDSVV